MMADGAPLARDVVIVGGGIAGLAAANRLRELAGAEERPCRLALVEGEERLGGVIWTERIGGFLVEQGPDSFLTEKPWALDLSRRLRLDRHLIGTGEGDRRTFVVRGGRLRALPDGFLMLAPTRFLPVLASRLFSVRGKLRMACDLVLPRARPGAGDESLASFVARRLGREVLERVAQPLAAGIYAGDPARLSVAATLPRFVEMERRHRSLIVAMRRHTRLAAQAGAGDLSAEQAGVGGLGAERTASAGHVSGARYGLFASFAGGMRTLVDALAARLPEGAVFLGTRARSLARGTLEWTVTLDDGTTLVAPSLILAVPAFAAAELLGPLDAPVASELGAIRYVSSATVTLAYDRADVPHRLDGFGFVVPAIERRPLMACTFASVKYRGRAPAGGLLLRVFCGGALGEPVLALSNSELITTVRGQLRELLGIENAPRFARVHRFPRAMPQYEIGHLDRVARIEAAVARHPGLALAGNAYGGVGIPDCVRSGERAAEAVAAMALGGRAELSS